MPEEDRSVLVRTARRPDEQWAYGSLDEQVADVYRPAAGAPPRATVVLIHGGFWRPEFDRRHIRPMASSLSEAGYTVVTPEYRRVPGQPDAATGDLLLAVSALPDRVAPLVVAGHSAGGHLALWLAAEPGVDAACLALAPVADLGAGDALGLDGDAVRAFLGGPASGRPDLDPVRRPLPVRGVTVLHGEDDTIVPVSVSRGFVAVQGGLARLVAVPGCGHFEVIDPQSAVWPLVQAEFARLVLNERRDR